MVTNVQSTTANTGAKSGKSNRMNLKTEDFVKMMITQLQQQDPTEPAKNGELLAQMSQIASLQSNTTLQESMSALSKQSQIGSAAGLIGKKIQGIDANDDPVEGQVTGVSVAGDEVTLQLDTGKSLPLTKVSAIAGTAAAAATTPVPAHA